MSHIHDTCLLRVTAMNYELWYPQSSSVFLFSLLMIFSSSSPLTYHACYWRSESWCFLCLSWTKFSRLMDSVKFLQSSIKIVLLCWHLAELNFFCLFLSKAIFPSCKKYVYKELVPKRGDHFPSKLPSYSITCHSEATEIILNRKYLEHLSVFSLLWFCKGCSTCFPCIPLVLDLDFLIPGQSLSSFLVKHLLLALKISQKLFSESNKSLLSKL